MLDAATAAETFANEMRLRHEPVPAAVPPDHPGEPPRLPFGHKVPDNLSQAGNERLARIIEAYWRREGFAVKTRLVPFNGHGGGFGLKSNIGPRGLPI
jgi:hypothetical protein